MSSFWKPQSADIGNAEGIRGDNRAGGGESSGGISLVRASNRYKHLSISQQRSMLPIHRYRREILYALEKFTTLVLVGETGCGKSTQLPQFLHEAGWTQPGKRAVVCTQPRRVAATTVAQRVAQEFGCVLGEEVGYGVRFDFQCSDRTVMKYCTDGVLLRETLSDPLLSKYSVIIVDEAHIRSLNSDILLGLLKKIKRKRPDLRVIITSATLNAQPLKDFFETSLKSTSSRWDTAIILTVQGRQFPVDILYTTAPVRNYMRSCVDTIIDIANKEDWGDILVFLPGVEEINNVISILSQEYHGDVMYFLPLYAALPYHMQQAVFESTPPNKRKVVIATNIAEASVTIEGIRFVIDAGFEKLNFFDVRTGVEALITCPISKAAAQQRAGRAGRTQEGKCFRLMTEKSFYEICKDFAPAEMQRVDISSAVLQLKALGINDVLHFDFLSPPSADSMIFSLELLYSLDALNEIGKLTKVGMEMAEMPVDARLSCALIKSLEFGCSEEMLSIAAMCSVDYPFITIRNRSNTEAQQQLQHSMEEFAVRYSDHLTLLNIFRQYESSGYDRSWCDSNHLLPKVMQKAREVRENLKMILKRFAASNKRKGQLVISSCGDDNVTVLKCIVSGYFSHAAKLGSDGMYHTLRGGGVAVLPHPNSVIAQYGAPPEWVIYNDIHLANTAQLRDLSKIDPKWLIELAPHYYNLKK